VPSVDVPVCGNTYFHSTTSPLFFNFFSNLLSIRPHRLVAHPRGHLHAPPRSKVCKGPKTYVAARCAPCRCWEFLAPTRAPLPARIAASISGGCERTRVSGMLRTGPCGRHLLRRQASLRVRIQQPENQVLAPICRMTPTRAADHGAAYSSAGQWAGGRGSHDGSVSHDYAST
jgi:hypothetical protein